MKKTVNQIKQEQGFDKKAPMCNNCKYFTYDEVRGTHFYDEYRVYQKNLRCTIGSFAVKSTNWCKLHERITVDFFEIGAGTHHKYMLFVLSKKKSTWTNQDEWNISDLEVDPLVVYHNSTFINPVPLNIFNSILISAKMTGINTDGAKYTFYPFSNFTSSPLLFHGTQYAYVKVTITNIAEHEVRYTTLQEVEVVSFWGTVEKGTPLVLDATTGNRVSMIVLAAGESRDYVLEIEQFAWHNGDFQLDNYPTGVVNSYIKLGFGELLDQTGTFQIQARNI